MQATQGDRDVPARALGRFQSQAFWSGSRGLSLDSRKRGATIGGTLEQPYTCAELTMSERSPAMLAPVDPLRGE